MLDIQNLTVKMSDQIILDKFNLTIPKGEIHALMGPNGSGKSTLALVLAGKPEYEVLNGKILFNGDDIISLSPEKRSLLGLFLAFQYPVEIPGVNNSYFIKSLLNAHLKEQHKNEIDAMECLEYIKKAMQDLHMSESLMQRAINVGFSGGEKKCNEILQLIMLKPQFAILDETDSGLDIDTLKTVAETINHLRDPARSFLIITHYQRLLNYIAPDRIHIMLDGKIVQSGDKTLGNQLESKGYTGLLENK